MDPAGLAPFRDHPSLVVVLDRILEQLAAKRQLGLLSITALRHGGEDGPGRWEDYESVLHQISVFLQRFGGRRMRQGDVLLDPVVAGNTYVMLLGPPRDGRAFDAADVHGVRDRVFGELRSHLTRHLPFHVAERHAVYVGGALVHHDRDADARRVIYRGLEESVADALDQSKQERTRQSRQLQSILCEGRVSSVYQPVIDILEQRVVGYEALTRLPRGEFRSPDLMFKVVQETATLWNLERLCRKRALEDLPAMGSGQVLFTNLEPDSFYDPILRDRKFLDELDEAGLEPGRLVLELTEHAAVKDFSAMRRVLSEVRSLGYRLALDDVGSGYAGLQAIAEIRPDYLKVDMTLVRDVHKNPIKRELISTICRFADSTEVTLVAEGVEQHEELESLVAAGVRCAQGFLFARPGSPPEKPDWRLLTCLAVRP